MLRLWCAPMGPVELLILLVIVGLPVLAVLLVVRALSNRSCPRCGKHVKRGRLDCPHCGFDFRSIGA
jgi:tRNA(Ile2) C34 agmatinyltransferase TiaS